MKRIPIDPEEIIFDWTDKDFAYAIKGFVDALNGSGTYSLTSEKYSVFTLIKKRLDKPFEDLLVKYQMEKELGFCKPSLFKNPVLDQKLCTKGMEDLSHSEKIKYALKTWDHELEGLIKLHFSSPPEFTESLDSLRSIAILLPSLLIMEAEKKYNKRDGAMGSGNLYCFLCWRPVVNQSRCCAVHDRSTKEGKAKYKQDYKRLKDFNHELRHYKNSNKTRYVLPPKWFADEARKLGFGIGRQEIRKLVFFLVQSKLNTLIKKETLKLRNQGLGYTAIAEKRNVSKQSVSKTIKSIDEEIDFIVHSAAIDSYAIYGDTLKRQTFISPRNAKKYETLVLNLDSTNVLV